MRRVKQPNDDRDAEGAREDQQSDGGDDGSNSVADSDSEKSGKSDGSSGDSDSEDRQASDSSVDILESPTMVRRTSLLDDELHIIENDEDESDDESDAGRRAEYERQKMEEQADSQGNAHMNHKDAESGDKTKENGDKESELVNNPSFTGNEVSGDLDHHGSVKPTNSIGITSIGEYQTLRNAAMRNDDNFCRDPLFYPIDVVDKFIASYQEGLKDPARTSKPQKESDSCHVKATTKTTEVDGNSENNGGGSGDKENKIDDEESEHLKPGDDEADEKMDLKDNGNLESDDIESDGDRESELSKGPASSSVRIEQDTKESDKHGWQKPENTMGINSLEHYKILMEAAMKGNKNYHLDPLFYPIHVVDSCIESYQDGLKDKVRTSELQKEAKTQKLIQSKAQGQVVKRLCDYGLSSDSEKTSMNLHPGTSGLRKKIKAKKKRVSPPSSSSDSSPELDNRQKKATTKTKEDTTSATKNKTAWKKPKKSQKHKSKSARWSTPRSTRPPHPASRLPLPDEVSCRRSCCCGPTGRYWKHLPAIDPY
ncbi:hypothetical protein L596_001211 [Steinernema carpocapsae]|uniref:Uncharacterized protein n=1 Tax=Steinernema carpocapsae TaxID=34508 RepID=A0A4U8UMN3_STECR|nr:hypothetical protein L596_001211 [Steinernema carpocapsae]